MERDFHPDNAVQVQELTPPSDASVINEVKTDAKDAPVLTHPSENTVKTMSDKALNGIEQPEAQTPPSAATVLVKQAGFGMLICEHCQKEVQRKTYNQRFCCDECRTTFHGFGFKKAGAKKRKNKIAKK